jgi:hypothetical protein
VTISDLPAAVVSAWAQFIAAVSTPFLAIFMWYMGRKVNKIEKQTDGLSQQLVTAAGKAGHAKGTKEATEAGVVKADALAEGQRQGREEAVGRAPSNYRHSGE